MISRARLQGSLRGLKIHNHSPITHQQFMDDNLLMGHPCVQESKTFKRILSTFSKASSMTINQEKLEIFFFNTPLPTQRNIYLILNFKIATIPSKYLGAPLIDFGLKPSSLKELLTKLELRMCQWTFRTLNLAGWLVLMKLVLQAIPLYLFSILAAPKWVLKAIRTIQRTFLLNGKKTSHHWPLIKWDTICKPKVDGSFGLRYPHKTMKFLVQKYGGTRSLTIKVNGPNCGTKTMWLNGLGHIWFGSQKISKAPSSGMLPTLKEISFNNTSSGKFTTVP